VAIAGVLLCHSLSEWKALPGWAGFVYGIGPKGVQLFFAISGFLITTRLIEEHERSGSLALKAFWVRRAFRILPPAMTYLAIVAGLAGAGVITVEARALAASAAFCRNYLGGIHEWYTGHFWSLAVEEQFYLVWPALLALSGLRRSRTVGLGFVGLVVAWRWLDFHHHWGTRAFPEAYFWLRSDIIFDGLLWGCLYALLLQSPSVKDFTRRRLGASGLAIVGLMIASTFGYQLPLTRTIQSMLFPAFIVGTALNPTQMVGRILELPAVGWLGRLSYSLYIWQQILLGLGRTSWLPLRLIGVLACAAASYYLIEKPMTRLGHRLAPPATPGHADLAAGEFPRFSTRSEVDEALKPARQLT